MRRKIKYTILLAVVTALLPSCRSLVLEDRLDCPRFLFFNAQNAEAFEEYESVYVTVFNHPGGYFIDRDTTRLKAIQNYEFYFTLRHELAVKGYGMLGFNAETVDPDGVTWRIAPGKDSDPLFRFAYQAPTQEESFIVPVEFVKDHSKVDVQFVGIETFEDAGGQFPFTISVTGNTCGIDALTGVPVRGPFEYAPKEDRIGHFSFVLPRQADNALRMEIYGKPDVYDREGLIDSFDFSKILVEQGGITWEEKNLPDLQITIDYQELKVSVTVIEWEEQELGYEF